MPSAPKEVVLLEKQKKCVYGVLEQAILTPGCILIISVNSDTGNTSAVYVDVVDRYGKSTAAQLVAASELESDLAAFHIDALWTKTNLAFLIVWTTKTLNLDSIFLEQPITESQKRIWFTCAIAPKRQYSLLPFLSLTLPKGLQPFESVQATPRLSFPSSMTTSKMLLLELINMNINSKVLLLAM